MKKYFIARFTVVLLLLSLLSGVALPAAAETEGNYAREMTASSAVGTYYVAEEADLEKMAELVNSGMTMEGYTFLQTADITLTAANFTPIGRKVTTTSSDYAFSGTYDGQRHTISNLQIYDAARNGVGLFGHCRYATLKNIGIESGSVTSANRAGGIAGYADGCLILNCYNRANITILSGTDGVGGIAGVSRSYAQIYGCFNTGTITCNTTAAGGISGWGGTGDNVIVHGCYNGGKIKNTGTLSSTTAVDVICRNTSRVTGDFSSSYYLAGCFGNDTDTYNLHNATKLEAEDNLLMAYVLNHAQGGDTNTNAFTVDEKGKLVFSADETEGVTDLRLKVWQDGVLLEDTGVEHVAAGGYKVPVTYGEIAVLRAVADSTTYEPETFIPSGTAGMLTVDLYLDGSYPSVAEYESHADETVFTVGTAEELAKLAELVDAGKDFAGKTVYVTADLDFSAYEVWEPIGLVTGSGDGEAKEGSLPFSGTFDGQYYHFKNINFQTTDNYFALFSYTKGATLRNIVLDEGTIASSAKRTGVLVSLLNSSTVTNAENHVAVYSTYNSAQNLNLGFIATPAKSTIRHVVSYGNIGLTDLCDAEQVLIEQQSGGIAGYGFNSTTIDNVIVAGTVAGTKSDPIARGSTVTHGYYLPDHETKGTMTWDTFLSGEAAWILNQNTEIPVWSTGKEGPVLDPAHPAYRVTYTLTETNELLSGERYEYYNGGDTVTLPGTDGYTLMNVGLKIWPLANTLTMPATDLTLPLHYGRTPYNIYYELNGGIFLHDPETANLNGMAQALPGSKDLKRDGYAFAGWYDNAELTGEPVTETPAAVYRDVTYYAAWNAPEEISTAAQLTALKMDGNYIQTADIDLTGVDFTPIGSTETPFTGSFDGNGYTISGLTIRSTENEQGLFGVNEGLITGVTLAENCIISGNANAGGIAGKNIGSIYDCISRATIKATPATAITSVKLMVQNLKISPTSTRLTNMKTRIDNNDPDILLLQEADEKWIPFLKSNYADTGAYALLYRYRHTSEEESTPVLYKKNKFTEVESGHFWLSDTPETASRPDGSKHWRVCTWAVLQDKTSGQKIAVFSTHLDNGSGDVANTVRTINAQALKKKMDEIRAKYEDAMVVTAGDFNCQVGTDPYETVACDGMVNTAYQLIDTSITTNIDHILISEKNVKPVEGTFKYLTGEFGEGNDPSDHKGVYAELEFLANSYHGGITGANSGTVARCVAEGTVEGVSDYGSLIGWNRGNTDTLYYVEQSGVSAFGLTVEGGSATAKTNNAATVYELNQGAYDTLFTLDLDGNIALKKETETPACIDADGVHESHDFLDAVTVDATCTEAGYTERTCNACGYKEITDEQPALGHTWGNWTQYGSLLYHYRLCLTDGEHIDYADHVSTAAYHAATCGGNGYTRYTCACDYSYDVIDDAPLNHVWQVEYNEQEHQRICQYDKTHTLLSAHTLSETAVPASCTNGTGTQYDCMICDYRNFVEEGEPLAHDPEAVETVPATCDTDGYTHYDCKNCDYNYNADTVPAFGHDYAWDAESKQYLCHCGDPYTVNADVNGDGFADTEDVILLIRTVDGWDEGLTDYQADVSGNGVLNIYDAVRLLQLLS